MQSEMSIKHHLLAAYCLLSGKHTIMFSNKSQQKTAKNRFFEPP